MKRFALHPRRAAAVAALVAATVPFAAVTPANASTYTWGCSLNPEVPVWDHVNPANGKDVIRYDMSITCDSGRTIQFEQHIHEADSGNDDHITSNVRSRHFATADTITMGWLNTLPNTEIDKEEMYHQVKFRVTLDNLSQSPWTSFEASPVVKFKN